RRAGTNYRGIPGRTVILPVARATNVFSGWGGGRMRPGAFLHHPHHPLHSGIPGPQREIWVFPTWGPGGDARDPPGVGTRPPPDQILLVVVLAARPPAPQPEKASGRAAPFLTYPCEGIPGGGFAAPEPPPSCKARFYGAGILAIVNGRLGCSPGPRLLNCELTTSSRPFAHANVVG